MSALQDENDELKGMINAALECAYDGQFDGAHHKTWVIDQMVRALTGEHYTAWVEDYEEGGEYEWDTGTPL